MTWLRRRTHRSGGPAVPRSARSQGETARQQDLSNLATPLARGVCWWAMSLRLRRGPTNRTRTYLDTRSTTMSDDEVIERYMRRFDRAVGAEPAALNELVESFSDNAVVNFDGTPYAGRKSCWSCSAGSSSRWSRRAPTSRPNGSLTE